MDENTNPKTPTPNTLSDLEQELIQALRTGTPADMGTAFAQIMKQRIALAAPEPTPAAPSPKGNIERIEPRERIIVQRLGWLEINHMPVDGTPKHARLLRFVVADRWALDIVI